MRSTLLMIGAVAATAIAATPLIGQDNSGRRLTASLDGASEIPGPGDPDGFGSATVRVNAGQGRLCYTLRVSGIDPASAAHIHEAPAGSSGPVVIGLQAPSGGSSTGCVTVSREQALDFIRNSEDYYVNVHNAAFPGGALRGQLGG